MACSLDYGEPRSSRLWSFSRGHGANPLYSVPVITDIHLTTSSGHIRTTHAIMERSPTSPKLGCRLACFRLETRITTMRCHIFPVKSCLVAHVLASRILDPCTQM